MRREWHLNHSALPLKKRTDIFGTLFSAICLRCDMLPSAMRKDKSIPYKIVGINFVPFYEMAQKNA